MALNGEVIMKDFYTLQQICLQELRQAGITPAKHIEWKINRRARSRWGQCSKDLLGRCTIEIASCLLEDDRVSYQACKETIVHELLHTCRGCKGHAGLWKEYAQRMNTLFGYNIKRVTTREEKGVENSRFREETYHFMFVCQECGQVVKRKRVSPFTRNYGNYICTKCGTAGSFKQVELTDQ